MQPKSTIEPSGSPLPPAPLVAVASLAIIIAGCGPGEPRTPQEEAARFFDEAAECIADHRGALVEAYVAGRIEGPNPVQMCDMDGELYSEEAREIIGRVSSETQERMMQRVVQFANGDRTESAADDTVDAIVRVFEDTANAIRVAGGGGPGF